MRRFSQGTGRGAGDGQTFICATAFEKSNETCIIFRRPGIVAGLRLGLRFATAPFFEPFSGVLWKYSERGIYILGLSKK